MVPPGRRPRKARNRGDGKRRGVLAQGWPGMTGFRVISRDEQRGRKFCVGLGYDVQRTE